MEDDRNEMARERAQSRVRQVSARRREQDIKRRRLALMGGVSAFALISLALLIWLFAPGDENAVGPPPGAAGLEQIDGTLLVAEEDQLVMRPFEPFEGQDEITFVVRERDQRNFDLAHLRSHSAIGLPTRVFFMRKGDELVAVYKEDAPANNAGAG